MGDRRLSSPHTNSTANVCAAPFLHVPILPILPVPVGLHVHLCVCVSVLVFSLCPTYCVSSVCAYARLACLKKSACVCAHNYFGSQGNCPHISYHKENIDIKWSNCATQQERRGMAISLPWWATWVNCLAFCVSVVMEEQGKESRIAHKSALGERTAY